MKKPLILFLILCLIIPLSGCGGLYDDNGDSNISIHSSSAFEDDDLESTNIIDDEENEEDNFIFSWLSYIELSVTKERKDEGEYKKYITEIFKNMKELSVSDVFVHAVAFADAFYTSDILPQSSYVSLRSTPFDVFAIVCDIAKEYDINVHAWINPYRISTKNDISNLEDNSLPVMWYNNQSDDVVVLQEGIYFNPASINAQSLILNVVKELFQKYDISGIHIDDYFYPENGEDFDKEQYEAYKQNGGTLSLADYRREQVNSLVKSLYSTVKSFGESKLFSISPCADIEKNYNKLYADVYSWCSEKGYCDIIIPQIYFGFLNSTMPFEETLIKWKNICTTDNIKLVPGLALYKIGQADNFAGSGKDEWIENEELLKQQIECLRKHSCDGFALYSASYINFSKTFAKTQLNNIKSVVQ